MRTAENFVTFFNSATFIYCIDARYGVPQYALDRILILQKKTIRNIHRLPLKHHTLSFFKSAEILKLSELCHFMLGIHMYKFTTNQDQFIRPIDHRYDIRNKNNLPIPRVNLSTSQLS